MNRKLDGKIAIITGSAAGIGFATARLFLEEGATVALSDISYEKIEIAATELSAFRSIRSFVVDISKKEQCETMVTALIKEFGRIDILINNAGITDDAQFYNSYSLQLE